MRLMARAASERLEYHIDCLPHREHWRPAALPRPPARWPIAIDRKVQRVRCHLTEHMGAPRVELGTEAQP